MIKQAMLVDIYDAPRDTVVQAFMDSVELNGNPFYHRWRIGTRSPIPINRNKGSHSL
jgi:hypothetical protein